MQYIYSLDKSSKKFVCPQCGKMRFVRYVDSETNQYSDCLYGRCDREVECGYHVKPDTPQKQLPAKQPPIKQPTYYIPKDIYQQTLVHYDKNNLVTFLNKLFSPETVNNVIRNYRLGTSKKWPGATLYWQINCKGQIGQGKIMLHNPDTGKRVKHPYPHVSSAHAQLNKQEQKPEMCYFGEHLLEQKAAPDDIKEGFDIADYFIKQQLLIRENKESEQLKMMKTKNPALQLFIDTFNLQELHAHR